MFTIALIGRTNVGKSTLFNRILGESRAITAPQEHTTRDRNVGMTTWRGTTFRCIDTGGVTVVLPERTTRTPTTIAESIRTQVDRSIREADLLLFLIDAHDGIVSDDRALARALRGAGKPILVTCNKAETKERRATCLDAAALGFGDTLPVSALTGMGVGDLLDEIVARAAASERPSVSSVPPITPPSHHAAASIILIGEPNVGKSSLINAILNREEVIARPEPFTTRDVHDVSILHDGTPVTLLDTAGIRRRAEKQVRSTKSAVASIERIAVLRSLRAMRRADVVCLVVDATELVSRHVKQLAEAIIQSHRACVLIMNKVDLLSRDERMSVVTRLRALLPHLSWAPIITTSAVTRSGVAQILPAAIRAAAAWRRELDPDALASVYLAAKRRIPKPKDREGERQLRMVELLQTDSAPPAFRLLTRRRVKLPKAIPDIIEHALREHIDFEGTPIVITVKSVRR